MGLTGIVGDAPWNDPEFFAVEDEFTRAADEILSKKGVAKLKPPPEPSPPAPKPPHPLAGVRRSIRDAIRHPLLVHPDDVNSITNRIYKGIMRPALAKAYALGFEKAADNAGYCCGCNVYRDEINPYDGSAL